MESWRREMKSYNCEVIRDLLVLYQDDICSEESNKIIQEHLLECPSCSKYLDNMKEETLDEICKIETCIDDKKNIVGLKRIIFKKNILVSMLSIVATVIVTLGGYSYFINNESTMSYSEVGQVSIERNNGYLYFEFDGSGIYRVNSNQNIKTDSNGQEYMEIKVNCTKTPYSTKYKKQHNFIYEIGNQKIPVVVYYEDKEDKSSYLIWQESN